MIRKTIGFRGLFSDKPINVSIGLLNIAASMEVAPFIDDTEVKNGDFPQLC